MAAVYTTDFSLGFFEIVNSELSWPLVLHRAGLYPKHASIHCTNWFVIHLYLIVLLNYLSVHRLQCSNREAVQGVHTRVASRNFRKGGQKWVLLNEGGAKLTF